LTDDRAFGEDEVAGPYNRPKLRKLTFSDDRQHPRREVATSSTPTRQPLLF
jgi:hypothetical protein